MDSPYRDGLSWVTFKHGKWVYEVELWEPRGGSIRVRIDLAKLRELAKVAVKSSKGVARRGPLSVRRRRYRGGRLF